MSDDPSRRRLGRGLAALIGNIDVPDVVGNDAGTEPENKVVSSEKFLPIELINRNPHNPRRHFLDEELDNLAQSIREHGIVQPVVVRPSPVDNEHYELPAGRMRRVAALLLGASRAAVSSVSDAV